jgi:hypothetical protein
MPKTEQGKTYNWEVSANAALAGLVRNFYIGVSSVDSISVDSLEKAYNEKSDSDTEEFYVHKLLEKVLLRPSITGI